MAQRWPKCFTNVAYDYKWSLVHFRINDRQERQQKIRVYEAARCCAQPKNVAVNWQ